MLIKVTIFICSLLCITGVIAATSHQTSRNFNLITDISWPNCTASVPRFSTGIIGVTGGLDFTPNPCLRIESEHIVKTGLYMNTGWPGKSYAIKFANTYHHCQVEQTYCLAFNYGYAAASYAIQFAKSQLATAHVWWLDVETVNSWNKDPAQNIADLKGMVAAINSLAPNDNIGFYAYPGQWQTITHNWYNHFPAWQATGTGSYKVAALTCDEKSFTKGPIIFTQFTTKLDHDLSCTPLN